MIWVWYTIAMKAHKHGYLILPDNITSICTPTEAMVYAKIVRLASGERGFCYATNQTIAEGMLGISERKVSKVVQTLIEKELIMSQYGYHNIRILTPMYTQQKNKVRYTQKELQIAVDFVAEKMKYHTNGKIKKKKLF